MASQITSLTIVYSIIYSDADQRKYQSSTSLAFVREFTGDRWIPRTNRHTVKIPKRLNTSVKHIGVFRAFVACLTSEYQLNTSLILLLNSKHNLNTYFNVCYNTMPILNTMQLRIKQAYVEGTFRPIQGLYHSYLGQHSPKRKVIIATTLVVSLLVTRLSSRRQLETFDCHNDELFEHDISSLF